MKEKIKSILIISVFALAYISFVVLINVSYCDDCDKFWARRRETYYGTQELCSDCYDALPERLKQPAPTVLCTCDNCIEEEDYYEDDYNRFDYDYDDGRGYYD